ncbi:MAG: MBL fold metallo-hydrolase [Pseudomonadota bacterium]|nr:MBL fold metallo-hydrolase [Pseudomonadota bacterium]
MSIPTVAVVRICVAGALCLGTWQAASAAAPEPGAHEFEATAVPMKVVKVAPHSYYVEGQAGAVSTANQGFNSNAAFVVTTSGVVVFDALGTPALGKRLSDLIARTTAQPVRRVILSHYHSDHFYGLQAFQRPGVDIWAHELVRDYLASEAPAARLAERRQSLAPWVNAKSRIVVPDRFLAEDTWFILGGLHFHVMHAGPAHTPEDLMMLVEEDKVLFVGDLVFSGRIPFVADADVSAWIKALDRVLELKPRIIVGGHGTYSTHAIADLAQTRDYLVYLRSQISAAFEQGLDFDSAYRQIDWSRFAALPAFEAANRRNAYQAYLNVERDALSAAKKSQR